MGGIPFECFSTPQPASSQALGGLIHKLTNTLLRGERGSRSFALTQSLSWAAWHSKKAAHTASHSARTAPERHAPASARAANDREPRSPLRAYWSVYELTHRARARGGPRVREALHGMPPNLLAHYCYLWEPTAVRQAIETAWISASVRRTFVEVLVPAG